ncbi:MAG: TIGR03915 family putative DNA repair protein [Clostridia bacterium]|nr:TIGR03915 family putative DNA repair protein [Clostridia bacterium]
MLYLFDGTENGFFTAFLQAFSDTDAHLSSGEAQLLLGQAPIAVSTDDSKAEKAKKRLLSFDSDCLRDLRILRRCGASDNEQIAFAYMRKLANEKRAVRDMLADEAVFQAVSYMRKVRLEIHHLHGFIRFMETESGALYAPVSPDHDICDLLLPHFCARFPSLPFVIHDVKRKKAAVYDGKNRYLLPLDKADVTLSCNEQAWQALWKKYYSAVNIPSRQRIKQMIGYMPRRYWAFMPEKNGSDTENPDET